jgi:type I restriction enzyme, S subunit
LDKADSIRRKRKEAIALTEELLRAAFLDMFGDPVTNPKGWDKKTLQSVSECIVDCPHSTPNWAEEGVICLRTSNLTKGGWNWQDTRFVTEEDYRERASRAEIEPGDIILSREGTVGIAAIVPPKMKICMGQRLVQIRPELKTLSSAYLLQILLWQLAPERISQLMRGSTSQHLNVKDLRSMKIPVPPFEIQNEFSKRAIYIESQKAKLETQEREQDTLFSSLLQRAFRGEL